MLVHVLSLIGRVGCEKGWADALVVELADVNRALFCRGGGSGDSQREFSSLSRLLGQ